MCERFFRRFAFRPAQLPADVVLGVGETIRAEAASLPERIDFLDRDIGPRHQTAQVGDALG